MADKTETVTEILDNIRRVFQVVNEHSKRAERETGLTGPQLWAIKTIAQSGPLMVSELARKMYLHPATVVGILDRLESRGLVKRSRCNEDRRVVRADLCADARTLVKKAPEVAQGLLVEGLERLPAKDLQNIVHGLDRLVGILGAQDIPPQLMLSPEVNKSGTGRRRRAGAKKNGSKAVSPKSTNTAARRGRISAE